MPNIEAPWLGGSHPLHYHCRGVSPESQGGVHEKAKGKMGAPGRDHLGDTVPLELSSAARVGSYGRASGGTDGTHRCGPGRGW
jgi:hypothetical protein